MHSPLRSVPLQTARLAEKTSSTKQTDIRKIKKTASVKINNYGQEDQTTLESMSYSALKKILKLSPDNMSILSMIKFIHANKKQPENRNIKLDNTNCTTIHVFKHGRWTRDRTDSVIYDLICRNRIRFIDVEPQLSTGMPQAKFEALIEYLEKAEDMSNSGDAALYSELAFNDLIIAIKKVLV